MRALGGLNKVVQDAKWGVETGWMSSLRGSRTPDYILLTEGPLPRALPSTAPLLQLYFLLIPFNLCFKK